MFGGLGSNRPIAGALILLLMLGLLSMTNMVPAFAAPVTQITVGWASGTPAQLAPGGLATAEWRVSVNDNAAAPSNAPVNNVTFTGTAGHGKFASLPDVCKTTGVTPVSSISADGTTLVCNLGTVNMGTAVAVQTPITAEGNTGDSLTLSGTTPGGPTANSPPIPIVGKFGMDMKWTESGNWTSTDATNVYLDYEWTLNLLKGSPAGPNSVTYNLTLSSSLGGAVIPNGCGAFTLDTHAGHPWSGGIHPADQTVPPAGSCVMTATATPNVYTMTLTGINYAQTDTATMDAAGNNLPTDRVAIASGRIQVQIPKPTQLVSVSLASSAPTYTSAVGGLTSTDDSSNNTTNKVWTTTGGWGSGWVPSYSGSPAAGYADTFREPVGTEIWNRQATELHKGQLPATVIQLCTALDTADVTLSPTPFASYWYDTTKPLTPAQGQAITVDPGADLGYGPVTGLTYYYYVGNDTRVTAGSAGYNPAAFTTDCNTDAANWTTTRPADLSTVKAVRTQYAAGSIPGNYAIHLHIPVIINNDTAPGTDVWQTSSLKIGSGAWQIGSAQITATPGAQYPATTASRDVMRVVSVAPYVEKSVDRASVKPGEPAVYTIGYAANGGASAPATVDNFVLTDTLPVGMTYVAGSASLAPLVTTNGSGQQVLTWAINGVTTNVLHPLTYQAVAGSNATPGQTLTNGVTGSVSGQTTLAATADVTVSTNGSTTIGKRADAAFIPNVAGDGSGSGSWTVTLKSFDPTPQSFTDTIDILPYNGDGRGTTFTGSYALTGVKAVAGATVYYTTAAQGTLSDDPATAANGSAGSISGNTVGWSTTKPANPTAVRVIGPALAPGSTQSFQVAIQTTGATGGDVLVNRAQARDQHTQLGMLTSAPITVAKHYAASLKKEVQDLNGNWHDANDVVDYPTFRTGDTVNYRITATNVGQGTLTNIKVADDKYPAEGGFTIASLAPGASQSHQFSIILGAGVTSTFVNTASASADMPADSQIPPSINIDPAGIEVANYTTAKTSNPASGTTVTSGQKVTYTVTVTQKGSAAANASFTDDLTAVLDDADYNNDAVASIGNVSVGGGSLAWNGTVPVGGTATITYSVTVKTAPTGDKTLTNVVTSDGCVPTNGQTPDCTTTHKVPLKFLLEKVGESSNSTWVPMAGSTWAIHDDANGAPGAVNPAYPVNAIPNQTGQFQVEGIQPGEYWLEETAAPTGFNLLAEPVHLTVAANGAITVGEGNGGGVVTANDPDGDGIFLVTVKDVPALKMPETGGTGSWPFALAGSTLLLAAFVLTAGNARRRRNQPTV
jgi:uncharacterized repeat protein (TIGR01451 family)